MSQGASVASTERACGETAGLFAARRKSAGSYLCFTAIRTSQAARQKGRSWFVGGQRRELSGAARQFPMPSHQKLI
jgi:hypothetical protein